MTQINISYPKGKMTLNLDVFLETCGTMKFRKLIKIIKMTNKPERHVESISNYINNYLSVHAHTAESNVKLAKECETLINVKEAYLRDLKYRRDMVNMQLNKILTYTTTASQEYILTKGSLLDLTRDVNEIELELKTYKSNYRGYIKDIKKYERINKNFNKYLELLKEV